MLPEAILDALAKLDFIGDDIQLQRINAGEINHNYRLTTGQRHYFLKCFADNTPTRLDRQALFRLQQQLAVAGLAPEPLFLSLQHGFLLETWHDIKTLEEVDVTSEDKVSILAARLARIHHQPVDCAELNLVDDWQGYLAQLGLTSGPLFEKAQAYQEYWQQAPKNTLCHHDLAFEHLCIEPQGMVLDWEYAACSVAEFDLASAMMINQLDDQQSRVLTERYARVMQRNEQSVWLQVQAMLPLAQLTYELWYRSVNQTKAAGSD
ncbi:phosphotransferase [Lacimicrobium sp. SS2-24]|uniref:phosphotransferase n=1 Tax=Lacimicrobium sp. SS2-24 TaxID=2005569 RepID=UPI000B4BBC14|nr:phosphotransferase [Lacimicrobium sp. SS2-24]